MKTRFFKGSALAISICVAATAFIIPAVADETTLNDAGQEEAAVEAAQDEAAFTPMTFEDDLGRTVTIEEKPERVAALLGSYASAWMLAGGEVVATAEDAWDDFNLDLPEECVNLGNIQELSLELLLTAEPDLIIASSKTESNVDLKDTFEQMGIPVLYFDVDNFDDYLHMLDICTQITGRTDLYEENGLKVGEQIDSIVEKAKEVLGGEDGPQVLYLRVSKTNVRAKGSEGTVLGEILSELGCVNIADGSDLLDNLTLEAIIAADPEYIFVVLQGSDQEASKAQLEETLMNNPAWSGLSAVINDKVYFMDKQLFHLKPNNRWGEAFKQTAEILYGDIFE